MKGDREDGGRREGLGGNDKHGAYHNVVKVKPWQIPFHHHGCSYQRTYGSAQPITSMQKTQHFIRVRHVSNPGIPSSVLKPVSKPRKYEYNRNDRIRGMITCDNISYCLACRSNDSDAHLAKAHVDFVVEEGCQGVSEERSKEYQRYDGIIKTIVCFQLDKLAAVLEMSYVAYIWYQCLVVVCQLSRDCRDRVNCTYSNRSIIHTHCNEGV